MLLAITAHHWSGSFFRSFNPKKQEKGSQKRDEERAPPPRTTLKTLKKPLKNS